MIAVLKFSIEKTVYRTLKFLMVIIIYDLQPKLCISIEKLNCRFKQKI